jgi:hypothetical protein
LRRITGHLQATRDGPVDEEEASSSSDRFEEEPPHRRLKICFHASRRSQRPGCLLRG